MLTTKQLAEALRMTPSSVLYWANRMPPGMATKLHARLWTFEDHAELWIKNQKRQKPGPKVKA
jgi:hypothetical protein